MAASRYYFTTRSLGTRFWGEPAGTWSQGSNTRDNRGEHHFTYRAETSKVSGGPVSTVALASLGTGVEAVWAQRRWITPPLAGQVLSGTFDLCVRPVPSATLVDRRFHLHVYISVGASLAVRTTLINNYIDGGALWSSASPVFRQLSAAQALVGTVIAGDRIVVEIGGQVNSVVVGDSFTLNYGTLSGGVPGTDATGAGDANAAHVPWMEFSAGLTEVGAAVPPPANDACADATVISSLPFADALYDTTTSADTERAVWYTWTAPASGVMFFSTLGSNYNTSVDLFTGSCGALVAPPGWGVPSGQWIGTSQAIVSWRAVLGTQYWFRVRSKAADDAFQARNSGGAVQVQLHAYAAPQTDDLFVNCQHIVSYREGVLVNATGLLYFSTPVGSAVDYTLRPIGDFNGGTHTALRVAVGVFGPHPVVELIDLATLNALDFDQEINDLSDVWNGVNPSLYENSLVFDATGRLILGFLGSTGESVIGLPSTADGCAVRRADGTHVDDAGPWPDSEKYLVAQDVGGSWFVDLSSDQHTIWYTSAGTKVKRYDLTTSTQLADFATVANASGPRPGLRSIRLLPPGDGTGGLLAAHGSNIVRLDAAGNVITTYTPPDPLLAQDLDKVELTADATAFWVSDQYSTHLFKFNLETGTLLLDVETNLPPGQLCGFSIYNGYRAGVGSLIPIPPSPSGPAGCPTVFPFSLGTNRSGCSPTFPVESEGI